MPVDRSSASATTARPAPGWSRDTIARLRPAYVLVEGPSDMNDRIGELLLGHELPIAVFS